MDDSSKSVDHRVSNQSRDGGPTNSFLEFRKEEIEQSIPDRFEQQVAKYPGRIAIKTRNCTLTYDAVNSTANRVAWAILKQSRRAEEPVALLFDNGAPFIMASLGALKAGRIQVPLESGFPRARLRFMLEQSRAAILVTDNANLTLARELDAPTVINIDELDGSFPLTNPGLCLPSDSNAAIGYTSGSTGRPKGIVWNHRGLLHAVMRHTNTYRLCLHDRLVMFRATLRAYLYALLNGAAYYPVALREEEPTRLTDWLMQEEVTVYRAAVSVFRSFAGTLSGAEKFPSLRLIELFGEPVYQTDVELYRKHFASHCILASSLGCNEFDDYACFFVDKDTPLTAGVVPGGYLMADTEVLLIDDSGCPVGVDHVGEIVIRSAYNAVGYWRRPDLTQAAFLPDPAGGTACLYRTGDLGRMRPDGCLFHVGRQDFQVKIRGHRVEVTEVEAALLELAGVKEAVVVGREEIPGDTRLVAYITPTGPHPRAVSDLRRPLAEKLPDYMVPSSFVVLDTLPLTATGKVDRRALPPPGRTRPALDTLFVGPNNLLEHQLAQIWEEFLDVRPIGALDNFFELGGHSLLAVRVMNAIEQTVGRRLPLSTLFGDATIRHLAQALLQRAPETTWSPVTAIQTEGSRRPFFFLHGDYYGGGFYCLNLARALGPEQPFFALHPHGLDGRPVPASIEAMAAEHLATVRTLQPHGPYHLGGHCNGGLIAFEMARHLRAQGERVDLLALMDGSIENTWLGASIVRGVVDGFGARRGLVPHERLERFVQLQRRILALRGRARQYRLRLCELSGSSLDNWVAILGRKARRSGKRLAGMFSRRGNSAGALAPPHADLHEIYHRAIVGYVPRRYAGPITLFCSGDGRMRELGLKWRAVAPKLEVYLIPGDHDTYITRHVQVLGEHLSACLQKVQAT
jgi:amino acid adenylation domain-containing protein